MVELRTNATFIFNTLGPRDHKPVTRTAEVRGNLLGPLEGRISSVSPSHREMVESVLAAQRVHLGKNLVEVLWESVEESHFVKQSVQTTLCT